MKRILIITGILLLLILIIGIFCLIKFCNIKNISDIFCDEVCQINKIVENKNLSTEIYKNVELKPNIKISGFEWIDDEHTCFRVRLSYINKPEDVQDSYYGDYFFIIKDKIQQVIFSDYSTKDLFSNGEHDAHFEDVTSDGNKDLIVDLRCVSANCFSRAFIFNNGKYEYIPSFEEIPNYKVIHYNTVYNSQRHELLGWSRDNAYTYTYYPYEYENRKFISRWQYEHNAAKEAEFFNKLENLKNNLIIRLKGNPENKDVLFKNYLSDIEKQIEILYENKGLPYEIGYLAGSLSDIPEDLRDKYNKAGITFRQELGEGGCYPLIDYEWMYNEFHQYLSEAYNELLKIRDEEQKNRAFEDGGVMISHEELRKRMIKYDNFINKYPDIVNIDTEVKEDRDRYYFAYETGLINTPVKCINPNIIKNDEYKKNRQTEIRDSYAKFLEEYDDKKSDYYNRIKSCYEQMTKQ